MKKLIFLTIFLVFTLSYKNNEKQEDETKTTIVSNAEDTATSSKDIFEEGHSTEFKAP